MEYKIVVLEGDGIGQEITREAVKVIRAASELYHFEVSFLYKLIGGASYDVYGTPLSKNTIAACRESNAVLLGAVGGEKWDDLRSDLRPEAGLLGIRKELNLFANLRPSRIIKGLTDISPIKAAKLAGVDIMIVRELTGGIYFGKRGRIGDSAYDTEIYSKGEIERILRMGFKVAETRRKKLCVVDKANVLESSRLWREVAKAIKDDYKTVELSYMYVDNCAMQLIKAPSQFDVIVTSNMFGDILSDEAAMITGSIGMLPSASFGDGVMGVYEGIHGSAPDISGKNIANPLATILSAAMLLRYSCHQELAACSVEEAVGEAILKGRTVDIASDTLPIISTKDMGNLVVSLME